MAQNTGGKLSFYALQIVNEQRNAYGLRYNDYERYRKHCANRTHRLRSSLKMTHGKGREFKKLPPLKLEALKDGHLQLLLFESERAWTYGRELLSQSIEAAANDKSETSNTTSLRRHAIGRMRRAVHWATQLLLHCQALYASSRLSAEALVQATVYLLVLNGSLFYNRASYEDGLTQLSVARNLLDELAAKATTSREQALAVAFADEISPQIRFCAHQLRYERAYEVDAIIADVAPKHRNDIVEGCDSLIANLGKDGADSAQDRRKLAPLVWEGEPVPVRNPELVDVLLRVQEAEQRLADAGKSDEKAAAEDTSTKPRKKGNVGRGARSKRGVAAYDAILLALSDAEDVARRLVEAEQLIRSTLDRVVPGQRDIQFVHAFVVYQLLSRRIQRDLLLISTLLHQSQVSHHPSSGASSSKARDKQVDARLFPAVVKLLDSVIQSLNQMRTLTVVDENPDLASATEARLSFTQARRCRYLARCYAPPKKYAEALTLTDRAALHLRESRSILSILGDTDPINTDASPFYPLHSENLSALEDELAADSLTFKRDWFAYNGGAVEADPAKAKAHKKPLFFDIALNYVALDMDRLQERAGKKPAAPQLEQKKSATQTQQAAAPEKKIVQKTKAEEAERASTPEPSAPAHGGLGSLLGGWWGRK
ncbi:hypothetical protein CERSUDRAFT_109985 [Gelatoporia subvermispora B]|uniref:Signal recognition particle subunit SRP68 n=1 Tax=Ceriporiopsis subvermispora (strain B) TaxID=914234 RepID=M2RSH8_CERS8|nr:hypothetical protein CERSUDRAFT_109985 [Gelatoporia subvermispora B]